MTYAIAWPYHCTPEQACPAAARRRILLVRAVTAEGPATHRRVREVARRLVDTLRPVTNALPGGALGSVDPAVPPVKGQLGVLRDCLSWLKPQVGLVSGVVPENVTTLRISLAGRAPLTVRAFGHDQPSRWAAFVSPPLARSTRVTRVEALDAAGRPVAESERDDQISHPVCHIFR